MYNKYQTIIGIGSISDNRKLSSKELASLVPAPVLFKMRKELEPPNKSEGFSNVINKKIPPPIWNKNKYFNKALFLDIDGTIRETEHLENKYPVKPDDVILIKPKAELRAKIESYRSKGYLLIGISNQSGIARNIVTKEQVDSCFVKTRELLGYTEKEFPILYCPHNNVPISCYCRKPQVGMGIYMIEKLKLDPLKCIMVGDRKTDETMATRLGMKYYDVKDFF
jgi:histidinol-phosphate phosphatase family protein